MTGKGVRNQIYLLCVLKYEERKLFLPASSPPLDYFQAPIHFSAWVSSVPGSTTCAKSSIVDVKTSLCEPTSFLIILPADPAYYLKGRPGPLLWQFSLREV